MTDEKRRRKEVMVAVATAIRMAVQAEDERDPVPKDMLETADEIWKNAIDDFFQAMFTPAETH